MLSSFLFITGVFYLKDIYLVILIIIGYWGRKVKIGWNSLQEYRGEIDFGGKYFNSYLSLKTFLSEKRYFVVNYWQISWNLKIKYSESTEMYTMSRINNSLNFKLNGCKSSQKATWNLWKVCMSQSIFWNFRWALARYNYFFPDWLKPVFLLFYSFAKNWFSKD